MEIRTWARLNGIDVPDRGRLRPEVIQRDPDLYPLYKLVIHRGNRRGEATGVSSGQVDLTTGVVTVDSQLTMHGGMPVYKAAKTACGERETVTDQRLAEALHVYRLRRSRLEAEAGAAWPQQVPS